MRKLLMIAAFAVFTACAKSSDTDVGETQPQTDEAGAPTTDQGNVPADETPTTPPTEPSAEPNQAPAPSTGYEPQPSATDTLATPPGDSAATERSIPDTSTSPAPAPAPAPAPTTTDTMSTTVPDSL
jgi:hypothetical protein